MIADRGRHEVKRSAVACSDRRGRLTAPLGRAGRHGRKRPRRQLSPLALWSILNRNYFFDPRRRSGLLKHQPTIEFETFAAPFGMHKPRIIAATLNLVSTWPCVSQDL